MTMGEMLLVRKDNTDVLVKYADSDIDFGPFNPEPLREIHPKGAERDPHNTKSINGLIKPISKSEKIDKNDMKLISVAFKNHVNHLALARTKRLAIERANQEAEIRKLARLCLALNRDRSIARIARENGFSVSRLDEPWRILWSDERRGLQSRVDQLAPYQRVNYFYSMQELVKTHLYAYYCLALRKLCPGLCDCFPFIWTLPREYIQLCQHMKEHPTDRYVRIPLGPSCRAGLPVFDSGADLDRGTLGACVVQIYAEKLFLIDGLKFKVSNFVLITAYGSKLRVFVYKEGVVQFYHANNRSQKHIIDKMSHLLMWFDDNGYNSDEIATRCDEAIVKTTLAINPHLTCAMDKRRISQNGKVCPCFQLIQINILLDEHLNPIVLKIKDAPVVQDLNLKEQLFLDTITLCCVQNMRQFRAMVALGNYLKEKAQKKIVKHQVKEWIIKSEEKEKRKIRRKKSLFITKTPIEVRTCCVVKQEQKKGMEIEDRNKSQEKTKQVTTIFVGKNKTNKIKNIRMSCERKEFEKTREMNEMSVKLTEEKMSKRDDEKLNNKNKSIAHVKNRKVDTSEDKNKQKTQFVRRYHKPKSYMEILTKKRMMNILTSKKKAKDKKKKAKKIEIQNSELESTEGKRHVSFDLMFSDGRDQFNCTERKQMKKCCNVAVARFHKLKQEQLRRRSGNSKVRKQDSPLRAQYEWEKMMAGNFRLIFPPLDGDRYEEELRGVAKISHFLQNYKGRSLFNVKYMKEV